VKPSEIAAWIFDCLDNGHLIERDITKKLTAAERDAFEAGVAQGIQWISDARSPLLLPTYEDWRRDEDD
jgi:hypothetical protein